VNVVILSKKKQKNPLPGEGYPVRYTDRGALFATKVIHFFELSNISKKNYLNP